MILKRLAIVASVALVAVVASMALAPSVNPSRLLSPAIFVSYDVEGDEARINFAISEGTGETLVRAYDDAHEGRAGARTLSEADYEYDPISGEVRFDGRTWILSGEVGSRRLENVKAERGRLWGTYYEDESEARRAEPYDPANVG